MSNSSLPPPPSSRIKTMKSVHGVNPKNLIEKIVRMKIQGHTYWKEKCIGLNEESLIDRATDLDSFGGTFGGNKQPTHFLCLMLKMLQIQPDQNIILEYIRDDTSKYLRLLGAFYLRLVGKPKDIYTCLEPLYNDYRTVRKRVDSGYERLHIDVFIKELLTSNYSCDIALPHLPPRSILEQSISLPKRISPLVEDGLIDIEKIRQEEKEKILNRISSHTESLNVIKSENQNKKQKETKKDDKMDVDNTNRKTNDIRNRDDREHERSRDDRYRDEHRDRGRYDDRDRDRYDNRDRGRYNDRDRYREGDRDRDRYNDRDYKRNRDNNDYSDEEEEGLITETSRPKKKIDISKYEKGKGKSSNTNQQSSTVSNGGEISKDQEIEEMNELRKKLGLAPLK